MSQNPEIPAAPAKSRRLLWLVAAIVVLLGGGGGAYWAFVARAAGPEAPAPAEPPAMVHFDAFVVNLADTGGARYLRLTLALVVEGEQTAIALTDEGVLRMRVRSSILELLAQETGARLVTTEGKAALKLAIAERASQAAEGLKVSDVLFSEFIVQ